MTEREAVSDGRITATWLADGPANAPQGLLTSSLARTRATRQRSAIGALVLGGHWRAAAVSGWTWMSWRAVLVAIAAMLVLIAGLWVAGATRDREPLLGLGPSASPDATASVPLPTRRPPATTFPTERPAQFMEILDHTVSLTSPEGAEASVQADVATFTGANEILQVERWRLGEAHQLLPSTEGVLRGGTFDEVVAGLDAYFEASFSGALAYHRRTRDLDGHPAVQWWTPVNGLAPALGAPFAVLVAVDGPYAYAFAGRLPGRPGTSAASIDFEAMLISVDFLQPYEVVGLDGRIVVTVRGEVDVDESTPEALDLGSPGIGFFTSGLRMTHAPVGEAIDPGLFAAQQVKATVAGTTVEDIAASLEASGSTRFAGARRQTTTIGGQPAISWSYRSGEFFGQAIFTSLTIVVDEGELYLLVGPTELVIAVEFLSPHDTKPS